MIEWAFFFGYLAFNVGVLFFARWLAERAAR